MRYLVIASLALGCSAAAPPQSDKDAAPPKDASPTSDASPDAVAEAATETPDGAPNEGQCAACTANDCLDQLQACAGAQSCVNDLVTFNDCLASQTGSCGTAFAAGGAEQADLWACLSTKCASTCGTE